MKREDPGSSCRGINWNEFLNNEFLVEEEKVKEVGKKKEKVEEMEESETWVYDCLAPFSSGDPVPDLIVKRCLAALQHQHSLVTGKPQWYKFEYEPMYAHLLAGSYTSTTEECHLIFTGETMYRPLQIFEARFEGTESVVVNKLDMNRNWIIGRHPRVCIFDFDTINPDQTTKKHVLEMCDRAIGYYSMMKMMTYAVEAPLKAYYKKSGRSRYFDIRFRATLRVTYDDGGPYASGAKIFVFEAKFYFKEKIPYGSWIGDGGRLLDVSMGHGSLFDDHI